MTIKVKLPFFDDNGLHAIGEIMDVDNFNEMTMEKVEKEETKKKKRADVK